VYGHNGSGKSTLSELLLSLAKGECATDVVWEDETGQRSRVGVGGVSPTPGVSVFTRKWVKENLSAFLDGEGAAAIVTLGARAIQAKDDEESLTAQLDQLSQESEDADQAQKETDQTIERLVRGVQDQIVGDLQKIDYEKFTKHRYSTPRVKDELREFTSAVPSSENRVDALQFLSQGAPSPVAEIRPAPDGIGATPTDLQNLLAQTPTRIAIRVLEQDSQAQSWVADGLTLHEDRDECLFCGSEISQARRQELNRHFDESWFQIRSDTKSLLRSVATQRQALATWRDALPSAASLASAFRSSYELARDAVNTDVGRRLEAIDEVNRTLETKEEDPGATPAVPDLTPFDEPIDVAGIEQAIASHNEEVRRHVDATEEREQTVLNYIFGSAYEEFRDLERQAADQLTKRENVRDRIALAEGKLAKVRQARFTTKEMADTLTLDLARVYGKKHLRVEVDSDGKSYACRRGDGPGTDLSEGERTTLALLYFLRSLEDEEHSSIEASQQIIVIDDPSSSLDREALFATHQWLLDTLGGFGQCFILTHDFGLLRLFLKSQHGKWAKSVGKIGDGNTNEIRFPRVAFLEMYADVTDGERQTHLGQLPAVLRNNTSEYAYLFVTLMTEVTGEEDPDHLFLLPNAARRVLEIFASYKAPHKLNFLDQLKALVEAQEGEPYRDVYDFCNRFSHGEGSESIDLLDARTVKGQIRRCMEFLRAVDTEHFTRMCQATGIEPSVLP
jgi:wobble nucleotide-excising tRNase